MIPTSLDSRHFDHTHRPISRGGRLMLWLVPLALLLLFLCLSGCASSGPGAPAGRGGQSKFYVKPTVAVLSFESIRGPYGWNLGDGLADILTDELVRTERFCVVERPQVGAVLAELQFQQSRVTRPQGRQAVGRLKNVDYLIKGKVTDFGHVSSNNLWAKLDMLNAFGARHKAVMRMTFYVVSVESGEIVASRTVERSVRAAEGSAQAAYKNVGLGGSVFYKTPLGRATAGATSKAVKAVTRAIASQPWRPRIALIDGQQIVINGGADRGIRSGECYRAMLFGKAVVDPDTGDMLGRLPGKPTGRVEVIAVHPRYAVARPISDAGEFDVGQHLEPVPAQ